MTSERDHGKRLTRGGEELEVGREGGREGERGRGEREREREREREKLTGKH